MAYKVGYIVGSLAAQPINRRLSTALIALAPSELELVEIPIKDLPLYNRDFDADYPPEGRALKEAIASVDAVLFVTPEYKPIHPRCAEERHRLGKPPVGYQLVRAQAVRGDRWVTHRLLADDGYGKGGTIAADRP
jgi:chromate reductase, NAD(P)H dehydrogenase (quinone)